MAAAIEQARPGIWCGAAALVEAVTKRAASSAGSDRFSASVDAVPSRGSLGCGFDLLGAAIAAVRTRAGNANITHRADPSLSTSARRDRAAIDLHVSPLRWREGSEVRRVPAFALVGLQNVAAGRAAHQHVTT